MRLGDVAAEAPLVEALAAALTGMGTAAAVLVLAFKALSAERRAGEQKARADALDVNLTGLAAQLADMTNRHNEEKQRADRLDDAHAQLLAEMAAAPAAGSYSRLLAVIAAAKAAAGGDGARGVYPPGAAGHDTDLEVP